MHFFRAGLPYHANDLAAGGAAHDGVVDEHDPFALEYIAHRIQFELHTEVAYPLLGLNEGTADVVVADQPKLDRDAALIGEALGGGYAGVGYRHHDIGVHRRFQRELAAHGIARLLHCLAEHDAVRA